MKHLESYAVFNESHKTEYMKNYRLVSDTINSEYPINTFEGNYAKEHLWKLPENWIKGMSDFIREFSDKMSNGWIISNVLHDISGFINKDQGFSPRTFREPASVWDQKEFTKN